MVDTLSTSLLPPPPPLRPLLPITSFPVSFDRAGEVQRLVYSYPQSQHTLSIPALSFKNGSYVNLTSILQRYRLCRTPPSSHKISKDPLSLYPVFLHPLTLPYPHPPFSPPPLSPLPPLVTYRSMEKPISVTSIYSLSNHTLGASYESYLVQDLAQAPLLYAPILG